MKPAVLAPFLALSRRLEGVTRFAYLDVRGLVTVGIGCLIDPVGLALPLPWLDALGQPATESAIRSAWTEVKAHVELEPRGGEAFESLTTLRLSDAAVDSLALARVASFETELRTRFPWDSLPADAQFALMLMVWALGSLRAFPRLSAAVLARDWATCAVECEIDDARNPGVRPRNAAVRQLFAACLDPGDPEFVHGWP